MSDKEVRPGWLPPRAPGAGPAPRFEREPPPKAPDQAPPPAAPPGWAPPGPVQERGYGQPVRPAGGPPRPTFVARPKAQGPSSPLAVTSIALGAIAILLLVFSLGVGFLLAGALAVVALGLGAQARRRIRAGAPGRPGQARAAVVLASIALGLALVAAIVWIALDASGFSPQDLQNWLEDELDRRRDGAPSRSGDEIA